MGTHLKAGLRWAMEISRLGNQYLQDAEPWTVLKTNPALCGTICYVAVNLVYLLWAFVVPLFSGLETRYFFLVQVVGLSLFVVAHLFFRIVEHHVEEMAKDDEPEQKIERAKVTWR